MSFCYKKLRNLFFLLGVLSGLSSGVTAMAVTDDLIRELSIKAETDSAAFWKLKNIDDLCLNRLLFLLDRSVGEICISQRQRPTKAQKLKMSSMAVANKVKDIFRYLHQYVIEFGGKKHFPFRIPISGLYCAITRRDCSVDLEKFELCLQGLQKVLGQQGKSSVEITKIASQFILVLKHIIKTGGFEGKTVFYTSDHKVILNLRLPELLVVDRVPPVDMVSPVAPVAPEVKESSILSKIMKSKIFKGILFLAGGVGLGFLGKKFLWDPIVAAKACLTGIGEIPRDEQIEHLVKGIAGLPEGQQNLILKIGVDMLTRSGLLGGASARKENLQNIVQAVGGLSKDSQSRLLGSIIEACLRAIDFGSGEAKIQPAEIKEVFSGVLGIVKDWSKVDQADFLRDIGPGILEKLGLEDKLNPDDLAKLVNLFNCRPGYLVAGAAGAGALQGFENGVRWLGYNLLKRPTGWFAGLFTKADDTDVVMEGDAAAC